MIIHNKKLWRLVLTQKKSLVPKKYYIYKTGTVGTSYIAEHTTSHSNEKLSDPVARLVDTVLNRATQALKFHRDNKTAAMCKIDLGDGKKLEVYFSFFDNRSAICTEIVSESPAMPIPKKKSLLLITSDTVGDTGTISFKYIVQDRELDARGKFPKECSGPFGCIWKTDTNGEYYMNVFKDGKRLFAGPLEATDNGYNQKLVEETFPEAFSMLCTTEVAEEIKPLIEEWVDVKVLHSEQTLLTA